MASKVQSTADLRKMLLDVIDDVRAGNIDYRDASAIGSLSSQILKSARLDFDVSMAISGSDSPSVESTILLNGTEADSGPPKLLPGATPKTTALTEDQRAKILSMKADRKPLHVVCDFMRATSPAQKKAIAEIYYDKTEAD